MTLIELMELYASEIKAGATRKSINAMFKGMGVNTDVTKAIAAGIDDKGNYIRAKV